MSRFAVSKLFTAPSRALLSGPHVGENYNKPVLAVWAKEKGTGHAAMKLGDIYLSARPDMSGPPNPDARYTLAPVTATSGNQVGGRQFLRPIIRNQMTPDGKPIELISPAKDLTYYGSNFLAVPIRFVDCELIASFMRKLQLPHDTAGPMPAYKLYDEMVDGQTVFNSRNNCISNVMEAIVPSIGGNVDPELVAAHFNPRVLKYPIDLALQAIELGLKLERSGQVDPEDDCASYAEVLDQVQEFMEKNGIGDPKGS